MRRIVLILLLLTMPLCLLAEGAFVRITRAEDLTENGEYVILTTGSSVYPGVYLLSSTRLSAGYYRALRIAQDNSVPEVLDDVSQVMVWRIAYGGSSVILRTADEMLEAKGNTLVLTTGVPTLWEVVVEEGKFYFMNGKSCLKAMLYSEGSTTKSRFGCYAASLDAAKDPHQLYIYKRTEEPQSMADYVRYFPKALGWETICLPFDTEVPKDCRAFEVTGRERDGITHSDPVEHMQAGVPYIIYRARAGAEKFAKTGDSAPLPDTQRCLKGTYGPIRISSGYVIDTNSFVRAQQNCLVPAFRAYVP